MKRETNQTSDLDTLVQMELNMQMVASLVLSFLGFWVLAALTGKSAPLWLLGLGWYLLLAGGAAVVALYFVRYKSVSLRRKLTGEMP